MSEPTTKTETEALVAACWPRLRRFFQSKIGAPHCYDLAQTTLLAFLEQGGPEREKPEAYLWGIARKQAIRFYERRRSAESFDSRLHAAGEEGTRPSSRFARHQILMSALRALPLDQQVAVELRYGEQRSLEEVAEALEVSLATAKRYLQKAQETLREELVEIGEAYRQS